LSDDFRSTADDLLDHDILDDATYEEARRQMSRWSLVFQPGTPAFDCLVEILVELNWQGIIENEADVVRHNAAVRIMSNFGDPEGGESAFNVRALLVAAIQSRGR